MKKNVYRIVCAWALLLCFATGQYMVYAHQHNLVKNSHSHNKLDARNTAHQTFKEKCALCDSMHHTNMELAQYNDYRACLTTTQRIFKPAKYNFTSIALILAAGRAPPVAS